MLDSSAADVAPTQALPSRRPASDTLKSLDGLISLTQAAKIAPGRPSTNCVWRWCRRGVRARDGERVRLRHVRIGGKIFTTADWLADFGNALAEADAKYFDLNGAVAKVARANEPRRPRRRRTANPRAGDHRRLQLEELDHELEAEGL